MTTLLGDVVEHLERNSIPAALIGAEALAFHGIIRSTLDIDLLTVSRTVLTPEFWASLQDRIAIDVRRGDFDDPLAGVVRFRKGDDLLDVVVAKYRFASDIVDRAEAGVVDDVSLRVVRFADLVLLKLFAGGTQDVWDLGQVLAYADATLIPEVESRLPSLPEDARALWERLLAERRRPGG